MRVLVSLRVSMSEHRRRARIHEPIAMDCTRPGQLPQAATGAAARRRGWARIRRFEAFAVARFPMKLLRSCRPWCCWRHAPSRSTARVRRKARPRRPQRPAAAAVVTPNANLVVQDRRSRRAWWSRSPSTTTSAATASSSILVRRQMLVTHRKVGGSTVQCFALPRRWPNPRTTDLPRSARATQWSRATTSRSSAAAAATQAARSTGSTWRAAKSLLRRSGSRHPGLAAPQSADRSRCRRLDRTAQGGSGEQARADADADGPGQPDAAAQAAERPGTAGSPAACRGRQAGRADPLHLGDLNAAVAAQPGDRKHDAGAAGAGRVGTRAPS